MFNLFKKDPRVPIYYRDHFCIMQNVTPYFRLVKPEKAKALFLWADSFGPVREMAEYGKTLGKPVIVLQHGKQSVREYTTPPYFTLIADKICVWGPRDLKTLLDYGYDKNRIVLTGCPLFANKERTRDNKNDIPHVVFSPAKWECEIEENIDVYNELIKIKGIKVTSKLIEKCHDPKKFGKNIVITKFKGDLKMMDTIFKLLRTADIVVTNMLSTFDLIAIYLGIPVVFIDNFRPRAFHDISKETVEDYAKKSVPPKSVDYTKNIKDLHELIKLNLEKPDRLKAEREKELYECAAIGLLKKPAENIRNVILGMINHETDFHIE